MAVKDLKSDRSDKARLVERVLSDPDLFPDEFKAWLPRWLNGNVNFSVVLSQLPAVEQWKPVGATGNATFGGTWVNFGGSDAAAAYMKDPWLFVHLKGTVKLGTIGTAIFTLPVGYRPQEIENFITIANGALGVVTINPSGTVVATAGSAVWFSLAGITFKAYS